MVLLVLALLGLVAAGINLGPEKLLLILNSIFTTFFLLATLYRLLLMDTALRRHHELSIPDDQLRTPAEGWPSYVVQVPLYKERHALPHLVKALGQLDYPKDKLDIQLLIEADDRDTQEALAKITIAPPFRVVSIPVSHPRTKPKACNVGLASAEGEFLVIYDAEDRPDPKQLKKAVIAFSRVPDNVACIQAKLSFFNSTRNLVTRCFTMEYAMWFDLCLPGLDRLRAPIPLGGTSNHFRLSVLKSLKGWDEYNVTEDCDLGLRLFVAGWRTRILDSVTWEEACPFVPAWTRQRSRWVKGYVQTYLVHTRDLVGLSRRLGVINSLHFHLLIGGSVLSQLLGPLYWLLVLVWLIYRPPQVGQFFPGAVFLMGALCLFLGNFIFVYGSALAAWRRGHGKIIHFAPLMVIYWILGSLAAWRGTLQLLVNPHFWEKTQHHES
jgi:glycosyltransferase XagB